MVSPYVFDCHGIIYLYIDLPDDFDWAAYLMEGISLASYSESDDEVVYPLYTDTHVCYMHMNKRNVFDFENTLI